jgi:DNA polymerase elongation subunit (family B)
MSATDRDLVFHLLDLHSRDLQVESETEDTKMVTYDGDEDEDEDEEFQSSHRKKRRQGYNYAQRREFVIHLFGATEQGQPVRCDVTGFRPSFYIRLPLEKTAEAQTSIKRYMENQGIPMKELNMKVVQKKIFYGFTAGTLYPFLQVDVPSLALFRNLRNLFLDDQLRFATRGPLEAPLRGATVEVFEANIDPMLRFLHTQDIQPCNWVLVRDGQSSVDVQDNTLVVECDYEQIVPTKGPRATAPFLTASWDIECFSMTGDFPLPRRTWAKPAKEVYELAHSGEHVVELILSSLSVGQSPVAGLPKGMTPIYCTLKKRFPVIEAEMKQIKHYAEWEAILARKGRDSAEEVLDRIEKALEKQFKNTVALQGDPCIQIGTTLTRGTPDTTERHLFVFPDCAPIPGIEVHAYRTEGEMILGWFQWMKERSPDILIGYNVFGFDESYVWHRAEELKIITPNSSIHALNRLSELGSEMKLEEKFLSSSAMGDNRMYIWTTQGRLQIDMFHYIKRNYQLPSYKLDEVTKYFMSGKIRTYQYDTTQQQLYVMVDGAVKDVRVGRSITLLDETGETVTPKLSVVAIDGATLRFDCSDLKQDDLESMLAELDDAVSWVVVKDDVGPQDIFRLHRGTAEDRAVVGKYCLQDCDLVLDLYKKIKTFTNSMSMANVCSVPITYIFVRGQGIKIESLIFKFCRDKGVVIPVLPTPKQGGDDSYEGAIVLDPEPGFYSTSTIGVCDFASLYPSTIVSENISHDSLLWVKDFTNDGTLIAHQWGSDAFDDWKGYAYTDIEYDIIRPDPEDHRKVPRKIKCGRRICRFAQPLDGSKSTLPQITTWLLKARSAKKKEMAKENDPEQKALLDAEQLAYKLTGNSLYGQLGSGTFKIRLQALAASVTAYGRKQILFAKAAIERFYGPDANHPQCSAKVMYGDTDSLFVEFNMKDPSGNGLLTGLEGRMATMEMTDEAGHFITKCLAPPHDFEFDKAFDPLLMFSKKRYAGNMYEDKEAPEKYCHKYMGIALKRRDNAPIVKTIFGGAMKMLLDKRDVEGAFEWVQKKCLELVQGQVSLSQLTITKSLRADYADPSRIAHKALADRITARDPGNAPAAGDRIGYVYIMPKAGQEASKLQGDRIETPQFIRDNKLAPDFRHYIEHQLQNPISQAFGLLLERIPGYTPEMMRGCPSMAEDLDRYLGFREDKAAKLLFSESLQYCERLSKKNAMMGMFKLGSSVDNVPLSQKKAKSIAASAAVSVDEKGQRVVSVEPMMTRSKKAAAAPMVQKTMSSFLLDSFIVSNIQKKDRAKKKADKEEKEEKQS